MPIDDGQARLVAVRILPLLYDVVSGYDLEKYPSGPLEGFRERFASLRVDRDCIADALRWKRGRWNAFDDVPSACAALIEEVDGAWAAYVDSDAAAAFETTFDWWRARLGARRRLFPTVSWIAHLVHHREGWPVVDRHNFRAMNHFLRELDPTLAPRRRPSARRDVECMSRFVHALLAELPDVERDTLDRFLMVYGRDHLPGRPTGTAPGMP